MADEDRERAPSPGEPGRAAPPEAARRSIDELVPRSRPPPSPRWLWITSLVLGAAGAIAFVVAALRGGDATSGGPAPASSGSSFPSGLVLGAGIGLAIGWVLGRRAAQSSAHSERSSP